VMDVYSRKILAWGISNTLEAAWCIKVVEEAIDHYGAPEIINSDQGSQYTSFAWGNFMEKQGIKISTDGKGRATDNAWIESFWRTIKKDHLYLNPAETGTELYQQVAYFVNYYNNRYHQGIKNKPNNFYGTNSIPLNKAS
jgi:putative transposase